MASEAPIPNASALACEYAPKRLIPTVVGCIMAGMPLGQVLSGRAAAYLLPTRLGWRAVFYLGGILPILVALALILWLPESVRFLTVRGGDKRKIARIIGAYLAGAFGKRNDSTRRQSIRRIASARACRSKHLFAEGPHRRRLFCCGYRFS